MGLVVDQAHLADVVAGFQHRQDDLAAARVGGEHTGTAVEQDEQRIALAALLDDQLAAAKPPLDDAVGDACAWSFGEHREQRHAPDQVQIRQHRHCAIPLTSLRLLWVAAAGNSPGKKRERAPQRRPPT
jgi:hypothetical protein